MYKKCANTLILINGGGVIAACLFEEFFPYYDVVYVHGSEVRTFFGRGKGGGEFFYKKSVCRPA